MFYFKRNVFNKHYSPLSSLILFGPLSNKKIYIFLIRISFLKKEMEVYSGPKLSSKDELAVKAILKNYENGQILKIDALHNVDFTDEEDIPGGFLMVHPVDAKLHVDSLPLNAFTYMMIVPILSDVKEADLKPELLHEAVPQFVSKDQTPPSLKCQSIDGSMDGKTWNAEFGEDEHAFAGIFNQTKGRDTRYFIGVQAGAPMACKQLRDRIARKNMTFEELLNDNDYNYAHYIAQRNAQRIAYNVARAFQLPIRHMSDVGAFKEQEFSALPMRAVASYVQPTSTVQRITHDSQSAIGVFNKLSPLSKTHFVYEGPWNGIAVFHMRTGGIGHALPSHSGKLEKPKKLSPAEISKRMKNVLCEGDIKKHPEIISETYKSVDSEDFLESMNKLGWKTQNLRNLIPIVIKIYNPNVKR